jgi:hypothetical protein
MDIRKIVKAAFVALPVAVLFAAPMAWLPYWTAWEPTSPPTPGEYAFMFALTYPATLLFAQALRLRYAEFAADRNRCLRAQSATRKQDTES